MRRSVAQPDLLRKRTVTILDTSRKGVNSCKLIQFNVWFLKEGPKPNCHWG